MFQRSLGEFAEVDGNRLPIGLQLQGKALNEKKIFGIAHAYEQTTDWHEAREKEESGRV